MSDIESFREALRSLISKLEKDRNYYLSKGYPEAQVRLDFINPLFNALDLHKKKNALSPSAEREKIEREIAITDEKIDEIFYKLYRITDEERKIIEGG